MNFSFEDCALSLCVCLCMDTINFISHLYWSALLSFSFTIYPFPSNSLCCPIIGFLLSFDLVESFEKSHTHNYVYVTHKRGAHSLARCYNINTTFSFCGSALSTFSPRSAFHSIDFSIRFWKAQKLNELEASIKAN